MIISHKHKFIFFKPTKVAGTSLELALAEICGEEDIVTPIQNLGIDVDWEHYTHSPRNYLGFHEHMAPQDVRGLVSDEIWNNYTKISVVRNPWDVVVSHYFWSKRDFRDVPPEFTHRNPFIRLYECLMEGDLTLERIVRSVKDRITHKGMTEGLLNDNFEGFATHFPHYWTNDTYYFDSQGNPYNDIIIRFENLQEDYDTLCQEFGVDAIELPRAKTKVRTEKRHYSTFYSEESRIAIAKQFRRQIKHFGYEFECL